MCSKIFCFDLDMTLLDHKTFHISEKVLKDLEALKKEGHVVAVATGRDMDSEFSKAYKKQLQPDAIVHSNGQKVTVGEKKIREVFMDPKLIARMMEFCREHHLCIGIFLNLSLSALIPDGREEQSVCSVLVAPCIRSSSCSFLIAVVVASSINANLSLSIFFLPFCSIVFLLHI